jgi:hypothetical protein
VVVPSNTGGSAGMNTYFDLITLWVSQLADAVAGKEVP